MADPTGREAFEKFGDWCDGRMMAVTPTAVNDYGRAMFQAGRDSMKEEAAKAIEAEADRLERLDKGPSVLIREFAARFRDSK